MNSTIHRREALRAAAGIVSLFGFPLDTKAAPAPPLPSTALFERDPEAYWTKLRNEQFLLPEWRAFLNNGSLGVAPRPVVDTVVDYVTRSAGLNVEGYPRWGYETLDQYRTELAEYVGCKKDELALLHNATEALSTIANGLDLKPGDEVIMTDQEHTSGQSGWRYKQARYGIDVRQVKLPVPAASPEQLTDLMISAIGPRTRVLLISGITSPTGLILPARDICRAARTRGVISIVDGAHMHGQIPVKISDLECDFFAGSPHKWMFAPAGCGMLYIREEMLDRLWPLTVTGGWDDKSMKAARFMRLGTNNRAILEGMIAGLRFAKAIGPERIYTRIHQLARMAYEKASAMPYIEMQTPADGRMYGGMFAIRFKKDPAKAWKLVAEKKIFVSAGEHTRISTHIHTRPSDIEMFFDLVREGMA